MTANERHKRILERLCVRRHDTRENLAVEFDVSERTIERDVLTLSRLFSREKVTWDLGKPRYILTAVTT